MQTEIISTPHKNKKSAYSWVSETASWNSKHHNSKKFSEVGKLMSAFSKIESDEETNSEGDDEKSYDEMHSDDSNSYDRGSEVSIEKQNATNKKVFLTIISGEESVEIRAKKVNFNMHRYHVSVIIVINIIDICVLDIFSHSLFVDREN